MKWVRLAAAALAVSAIAIPAAAQMGFDGELFVKAVREKDGDKATELLESRSATIVNSRDSKGETALIVAISRRDDSWTGFLLNKGANPNYPAQNGDTPLIAAARVGYEQGVQWLLGLKAKVDAENKMGETPLIIAVQQRNAGIVRRLLAAGANPDKTDSAAGYSARDYAKRDTRAREILAMMETPKKPLPKVQKLDDFKLE